MVVFKGKSEPEVLEDMDVFEGVNLAQIRLARNSLSVVKVTTHKNLCSCYRILEEINTSIAGFTELSIVHESRALDKELML
jgi:hypothetical protein